jgi:hypothetical protein
MCSLTDFIIYSGYFPLHEDTRRSHKPHSLHQDTKSSSLPRSETSEPRPPLEALADSCLRSTFMPTGNYYPSNYKDKSRSKEAKPPIFIPTRMTSGHLCESWQASDIKQKTQRHQARAPEAVANARRLHFFGQIPQSPKLLPLEVPGPVTSLELEGGEFDFEEWLFE